MIDAYIDAIRRKFADSEGKGPAIMLTLLSLLIAVGAWFIPIQAIQVVIGAAAGMGMFTAVYLIWWKVISPERREQLDWRGRLPQRSRLNRSLVVVAVWAVLLLLLGSYVPSPVFGAVTVCVGLIVWRQITYTPEERKALLVASELEDLEQSIVIDPDDYADTQEYVDDYPPTPNEQEVDLDQRELDGEHNLSAESVIVEEGRNE